MKKLLALLLALVMVLSFAACGEGDEEEETSRRRKKDTETTSDTTEGTEPEETEDDKEEDDENKDSKASPYTIFDEMDVTVLDTGDLTLSFGELEDDNWGNTVCKVEGENYSGGTLNVTLPAVAVNGMMTNDYFFLELEEDSDDSTEFTIYDIDDPDDLTRLSMLIRVTDEDYESEYHLIEIYPQGKKAHKENRPDRDGNDVLLDKKGLYVVTQDLIYSDNWDPQLRYLAFNDADEVFSLSLDPIAINGFGVNDYHGNYILPDTYLDHGVDLYEHGDLCLLGMEPAVTSLTMNVSVDNLDYETVTEDQITIYPEGKKNEQIFTYTPEADDVVILETEDFKLMQVSYIVDEWNDSIVTFVVENKSGKTLSFNSDDTKINGKEVDFLFFYCDAKDGRDTFTNCYLYEASTQEANISKITSMEFTLEVWDDDYEDIYEGTVKFDVK